MEEPKIRSQKIDPEPKDQTPDTIGPRGRPGAHAALMDQSVVTVISLVIPTTP
jgi:hypothetical protein